MISFEEKAPTQLQEIRIPILSLLMAIIKAKLVMIKRQKNRKTKHDDDYLLTKINHKVLVEARPFTTAKTNNMYERLFAAHFKKFQCRSVYHTYWQK